MFLVILKDNRIIEDRRLSKKLEEWIERKNDSPIVNRRARKSSLDNDFGESKEKILDLIYVKNIPIKQMYEELKLEGLISDVHYNTFLHWARKNDPLKNVSNVEATKAEDENILPVNKSETDVEEAQIVCHDSREMFYGFDMNKEPDPITNPLPQIYEISKEYIFNIFADDTSLNNEKIVHILLYEISARGENIFKDIWPFMLIEDRENIQQYYDRLQGVINTKESYSFGVTNATACISDIAFSCGCDKYKIIRRTV
jgi:hypothetical protein